MAIRQRGRKKVKTVRVLTDADPRRVSLVEHGANQTPWREVKMAAKGIKTKETEMPKKTTKKSGAELVRITFAKSKFADVAAVKSWLTEKGYVDTDVADEGDDYVVTSPAFTEAKAADIRVVDAEEGIRYSIAKDTDEGTTQKSEKDPEEVDDEPEADADDEEADDDVEGEGSDETATKAAAKKALDETVKELTEKVNMMRVYYSDKQGMKDVLKDANDGMPIGVGDLYSLFTKSLQNAAEAGDMDAVKNVSKEFGDMFTEMMDVTNKFIAGASEKEGTEKQVSENAEVAAKAVADAQAEKTAALKEVETLKEQVVKAAAATQEMSTALETLKKSALDEIKALSERVSALENVEQSRKGADEETTTKTTEKPQSISKLEANIWGISLGKS